MNLEFNTDAYGIPGSDSNLVNSNRMQFGMPQSWNVYSHSSSSILDSINDLDDSYNEDDDDDYSKRNRGNYRCSRCGEPKKGHICPYQPTNFKCNRCGRTKVDCSCEAPKLKDVSCQCEFDEEMTLHVLDVKAQGAYTFHSSIKSNTSHEKKY